MQRIIFSLSLSPSLSYLYTYNLNLKRVEIKKLQWCVYRQCFIHDSNCFVSTSHAYLLQEEDAIFMEHGGKYRRVGRKLSRVACARAYTRNISSHNSLSSKGLRAELCDRIFFQFMEVRQSSFIVVVGLSIKVPTKFASRVTILSSFPSILLPPFPGSSFSR